MRELRATGAGAARYGSEVLGMSETDQGEEVTEQQHVVTLAEALRTIKIGLKINAEVDQQEQDRGVRQLPDGTGTSTIPMSFIDQPRTWALELANAAAHYLREAEKSGVATWVDVLLTGAFTVGAEDSSLDNLELDHALVQLGATSVAWLKDRERRREEQRGLSDGLGELGQMPVVEQETTVSVSLNSDLRVERDIDEPEEPAASEADQGPLGSRWR